MDGLDKKKALIYGSGSFVALVLAQHACSSAGFQYSPSWVISKAASASQHVFERAGLAFAIVSGWPRYLKLHKLLDSMNDIVGPVILLVGSWSHFFLGFNRQLVLARRDHPYLTVCGGSLLASAATAVVEKKFNVSRLILSHPRQAGSAAAVLTLCGLVAYQFRGAEERAE